ncbi:MAG: hypothetical protein RLZ98_1129 [Pseudomonadota bacterium]|jgi:starvation-inducible DNA-binding protein
MSKKPTSAKAPSLTSNARGEIAAALQQSIAETSVAQMKAQNFHWNVEGMAFGPLHDLFGKIYEEHFAAIDDLAERIKALGGHADGRYSEYLRISGISEANGKEDAKEMLQALKSDQEQLSETLRSLAEIADNHGDVVTNDMAIARAEAHDKFAWMLAAHLRG